MLTKTTFVAGIGFDKEGTPIAEHDALAAIVQIRIMLSWAYGGFTESHTVGGWNNGKETVTELGRKWECVGDYGLILPDAIHKARRRAGEIAAILNQQSVLFSVEESHFEFVEQNAEINK